MRDEHCPTCEIARHPDASEAADQAVRKVFAILGVDIDRPESVEEFREDLRFGRRMRRAADHGFLALVGLAVVGLGAVIWSGVLTRVGGGT
jgi:hypothetical protein